MQSENRRVLLLGAVAALGSSVSVLGSRSSALAQTSPIGQPNLAASITGAQKLFIPEPTVGNIFGRAMSGAVYVALAAAAPLALLTVFSAVLVSASIRNTRAASDDYIDFRMDNAEGDIKRMNIDVKSDVVGDGYSFRLLADAIEAQQTMFSESFENQSSSISEQRQMLASLQNDLQLLEIEEQRASSATSVYDVSRQRVQNSRYFEADFLGNAVGNTMNDANRCQAKCSEFRKFVSRL